MKKRLCNYCDEPMYSSWAGLWINGKFVHIHKKCQKFVKEVK